MLEAIVLLWMAIKMQAPIWVLAIVVLMLLVTTLSALLSVVEKIQEKRRKEETSEEFRRWVREQGEKRE